MRMSVRDDHDAVGVRRGQPQVCVFVAFQLCIDASPLRDAMATAASVVLSGSFPALDGSMSNMRLCWDSLG